MKCTISPGPLRSGLLILLVLIFTGLTGCAVRTHRSTPASVPHTNASPDRAEHPDQDVPRFTPKALVDKGEAENDAAEQTGSHEKPSDQQAKPEDHAENTDSNMKPDAQTERKGAEYAGPAAKPKVMEPSADARPMPVPANLLKEFAQAAAGGKELALTFDAGASPKPTSAILATLKQHGLHCTFFLTGKWMQANPELTRRIVREGHEIGNHSYSHPDFRKLSDDQIREQLERTEQIALDTAGTSTKPLFRPPFGGRDKRVKEVLAEAGYRSIYWSIDSWDAYKKGITADEIRERVLSRVKGGDVVLMHCGSAPTAEALPSIIEELQARGYRLVKVSEIL